MSRAKKKERPSPIVQRRKLPTDSLDYFPTPPWQTRAFVNEILFALGLADASQSVWEPAAGEGHMAEPLRELFALVHASDVHDYGEGYAVGSFVGDVGSLGLDLAQCPFPPDWIISNPPFVKALEFLLRALGEARVGVAFLLRLAWLEAEERYSEIFSRRPPTLIVPCVDRVPMVAGRYDPTKTTTMAYAWFVWTAAERRNVRTEVEWLRPGAPSRWIRPQDLTPRFARSIDTHPNLFEEIVEPPPTRPSVAGDGGHFPNSGRYAGAKAIEGDA